jgi:WD40 repeat protein
MRLSRRNRVVVGFVLLLAAAIAWSWQRAGQSQWRVRAVLAGHSDSVNSLAFSPDGSFLVTGSSDRTAKIWDTNTWVEIGELHAEFSPPVWAVAVSPDQRRIATGGWMGEVDFWDPSTRRKTAGFRTGGEKEQILAFGPTGDTLACFRSQGVTVYDLTNWKPRASMWWIGPQRARTGLLVTESVMAPGTDTVAIGHSNGEIHLLDCETLETRATLVANNRPIRALAVSPGGKWLASISADQSVRLWDAATGELVRELGSCPGVTRSIVLAPDGDLLAYVARGQRMPWWSNLPYVGSKLPGKPRDVWDVNGLRVPSAEPLYVYEHFASISDLAFSPDGTLLATASSGGTITLIEVPR